jgi:hypothetical protein
MLTINDLHNEQELSAFEMGKVAGGEMSRQDAANVLYSASNFFASWGASDAQAACHQAGMDIACCSPD